MPVVDVRTPDGATVGSVELDEGLFGITPHVPVLHQVVTAQLAAARRGTQSTKTRAEVSGGGAKPFRQKGTGRARQGSTRAPHWSGGGIALGPKPRSYKQRTPKKMIRLALASALSDRAAEGRVAVVDEFGWDEPKTQAARGLLDSLGLEGKVMVVVSPDDEVTIKSFRNLPEVALVTTGELNAYDVLCSDWVLFSRGVLPGTVGELDTSAAKAAPAKAAAAPRQEPPKRRAVPEPEPEPEAVEDEVEPVEEDAADEPVEAVVDDEAGDTTEAEADTEEADTEEADTEEAGGEAGTEAEADQIEPEDEA
jgi:large subunit ribosomal protein L4